LELSIVGRRTRKPSPKTALVTSALPGYSHFDISRGTPELESWHVERVLAAK
jgi:hypothetical protein